MSAPPPDAQTAAESATTEPQQRGLIRVARNLTLVNASVTAGALLTSPLQARALGPDGRGDLAAVIIVLGLVPALSDFGLSTFAATETARGTDRRIVIGSIGPLSVAVGLVVAAASPLIASIVAGGRPIVYGLTLVAMALMPLFTFGTLVGGIIWGEQRWGVYAATRLIPPIGLVATFLTLYLTHSLSVASGGITVLAVTILSTTPSLFALRGTGRPRWSASLSRRGRKFGIKVWLGALALQTNARLDQLLMIRLVAPRELGLYVIAVNISLVQSAFIGAVAAALVPRVAAGEQELAARALRVMLMLTGALSAVLIVTVPIFIPVVFGESFRGAVFMSQILVLGAVPFGAAQVMTALFTAMGEPARAARGQLIGILVTVPLLVAFVSRFGGEGAAVISLVSYTLTAGYLGHWLRRRLEMPLSHLLVPRREDLATLRALPILRAFAR